MQNGLDFLDYKRQEIIDKIQKKAIKEGFVIEFNSSLSNKPSLVIDYNTNYDLEKNSLAWHEAQFGKNSSYYTKRLLRQSAKELFENGNFVAAGQWRALDLGKSLIRQHHSKYGGCGAPVPHSCPAMRSARWRAPPGPPSPSTRGSWSPSPSIPW